MLRWERTVNRVVDPKAALARPFQRTFPCREELSHCTYNQECLRRLQVPELFPRTVVFLHGAGNVQHPSGCHGGIQSGVGNVSANAQIVAQYRPADMLVLSDQPARDRQEKSIPL